MHHSINVIFEKQNRKKKQFAKPQLINKIMLGQCQDHNGSREKSSLKLSIFFISLLSKFNLIFVFGIRFGSINGWTVWRARAHAISQMIDEYHNRAWSKILHRTLLNTKSSGGNYANFGNGFFFFVSVNTIEATLLPCLVFILRTFFACCVPAALWIAEMKKTANTSHIYDD